MQPQYRIGYKSTQPTTIEAGQQGVVKAALFVGPKEQERLNEQGAEGLALTVDYCWLTLIASPLFKLLIIIHSFVQNWGWSIILLTLCT